MHLAPWSGAKSIKLLVLNGSQKFIKIGQEHRYRVARKICLPRAWPAPWNVMRSSKTPFPTPTVSQPSHGQVWPAQRTRVRVQVEDFNDPTGENQQLWWEGARGRQAGPGGAGTWGRLVGLPRRRTWSEPAARDRSAQEGGSGVGGRHPVSGRACWPPETAFWTLKVWSAGASRESITWGPTRDGPRHSWTGLEFWVRRLTSLRTIGQVAEHSGCLGSKPSLWPRDSHSASLIPEFCSGFKIDAA